MTVVVPELFKRRSLVEALLRRTEFKLKLRLPIEADVAMTNVPLLAADGDTAPPTRAVCRILVSGAHAATMRAVHYAASLGLDDTRAIFFAFDADELGHQATSKRPAAPTGGRSSWRKAVPRRPTAGEQLEKLGRSR